MLQVDHDSFCVENEGLKRGGLQGVDSSDYQMSESGMTQYSPGPNLNLFSTLISQLMTSF